MKIVLLTLRYERGKPFLDYRPTMCLVDFFCHTSNYLEIDLPSGKIFLNKWQYINKYRVYQDPHNKEMFFIVASYKKPDREHAIKILERHYKTHGVIKIKRRKELAA